MIYRNDNIKEYNEGIIAIVKDAKEYYRYELASQCMSFDTYEDLICNGRIIFDLIEKLESEDDNKKIITFLHPMGYIEYKEYDELEVI
jgi:hypothetical protein